MKSTEKKSVIDRYKNKVRDENRRFIERNLQISNQISEILVKKGLTQKDLACLLGKHESEISKILSGLHNITLKTITKIETVLSEDIIMTPSEASRKYTKIEYVTLKVSANKNNAGRIKNKFIESEYNNNNKADKAA